MTLDKKAVIIFLMGVFVFCLSTVAVADPLGDINGDGKIGLEESIYALQVVVGLDLIGPGEIYPAMVEKSGQITSYSAGDDGELQRGVDLPTPRFTDNGDGTVTDLLTGLMWTKDANIANGQRTWAEAISDCEACTAGDCTDWHLPQVKELQSLIHFGYYAPALSDTAGTGIWTEGDPFTDVRSYYYWSSSTYAYPTVYAWSVGLNNGGVYRYGKGDTGFVWCVRGGPN